MYPSSAGFPLDFPHSLVCFKTHFLAIPGWKTDYTNSRSCNTAFLLQTLLLGILITHRIYALKLYRAFQATCLNYSSGAYRKFTAEMHTRGQCFRNTVQAPSPSRTHLHHSQREQQCLAFSFDELGRWEQIVCFQLKRRVCIYSTVPGEFPQIKGGLSTQATATDPCLPAAQRKRAVTSHPPR